VPGQADVADRLINKMASRRGRVRLSVAAAAAGFFLLLRSARAIASVKRWSISSRCWCDHPPYGYEPTREAAMIAFAKSWRWE
jgi:hypothetical protein